MIKQFKLGISINTTFFPIKLKKRLHLKYRHRKIFSFVFLEINQYFTSRKSSFIICSS